MNKENRHVKHCITHQALVDSKLRFLSVLHCMPIHKQSKHTRSHIKIKKLLEGNDLE